MGEPIHPENPLHPLFAWMVPGFILGASSLAGKPGPMLCAGKWDAEGQDWAGNGAPSVPQQLLLCDKGADKEIRR